MVKKNKPVQMAKTTDGWFNGKVIVPFHDLTDKHLQNALLSAERQELYFFNRSAVFAELAEKLMDEAEKRGLELRHNKSKYTFNSHIKGHIKAKEDEN